MEFSVTALTRQNVTSSKDVMSRLDAVLAPRVYLVGYDMTLADLAVFGAVRG